MRNALDMRGAHDSAFGRADVLLTNDDKVRGLGEFEGVPIRRPDWQGDLPFDFGPAD